MDSQPYKRRSYLALALHNNLAIIRDARQHTLLENENVLFLQTEVLVLGKELLGRLASRPAGHHIPGDGSGLNAVSLVSQLLQLGNTLRLQLEQRLLAQQADIETTLGSRAAEASTLATGHQHHRHIVLGNLLQAGIVPGLQVGGVGVDDGGGRGGRQGFEGGGGLVGLGRVEGLVGELVDARDVKGRQLVE